MIQDNLQCGVLLIVAVGAMIIAYMLIEALWYWSVKRTLNRGTKWKKK